MTREILHDQNVEKQIEKQMGCMAGFFQLFDRHQILTGKRLHATKRLPPPAAFDSSVASENSIESPAVLRELEKPQQTRPMTSPSTPDRFKSSPVTELRSPAPEVITPAIKPSNSSLPLPIFEFKEGTRSSWKFCKEAPRLSLDSRATFDAKGSLYPKEIQTNAAILSANRFDDSGDEKRPSPSVIAKLMGLEPLPNKAELRRSASESRVSRDLFQSRNNDSNNFQLKQENRSHSVRGNVSNNVMIENSRSADTRNGKSEPLPRQWKSPQQRKSFFDSGDFFPEPKQRVSIYGEIEKRLQMRGIEEPSKDLETLKQILEALQLKGLLHSKNPPEQITHRNFVYQRSFSVDESSIVIMKPSTPTVSHRGGVRLTLNNANQGRGANSTSPTRRESNIAKSPVRRKVLSVETQRKGNESSEQRRGSPIHSPKLSPKRVGSDKSIITQSPRNRKPTAEIDRKKKIANYISIVEDESSSISESSVSTYFQTDAEGLKVGEYKEGRSLLERCDKLVHSILEMTANELQPSPVSVLDSSFYQDESSSPSPVMRRSIHFKDQPGEFEEEIWTPVISPVQSKCCNNKSEDCDFIYISDILRASNYLPEDSNVFQLLEKQQYLKGNDTSKSSRLQRKLIFDTITEILDQNKQLPPWKVVSWSNSSNARLSLGQIWSEFQRIRERDSSEEDLFDIICSVLRKDLARDGSNGWGDCHVEMSEAVLDIERMIFKDLVGETIRDLAAFAGNGIVSAPRRKLVF